MLKKSSRRKKAAKKLTTDKQRIRLAGMRIDGLVAEIRGYEERGAKARATEARMGGRISELEAHVLDLRRHVKYLWSTNDMMRTMLVSSEVMADGRAFREHVRSDALDESRRIVYRGIRSGLSGGPEADTCSPPSK